jgi:ABC-type transport system involved in cytochrome c biogenesis permease subunit
MTRKISTFPLRLMPFLVAAVLLSPAWMQADAVPLDTNSLATLAVQDHGRKKPFTTFAHEVLLTLSGQSSLQVEGLPRLTANEIILNLWLKPEGWDERPMILINFLQLKDKLGLPEERKLFTFGELIKSSALMALLDEAQKQRQAGKGDTLPAYLKEAEHLGERLRLFQDLVDGQKEAVVPDSSAANGKWTQVFTVDASGNVNYAAPNPAFAKWMQDYRAGDIAAFNAGTPRVVDSLRQVAPQFYPSASSLQFEHTYMTVDPFLWAWVIYFAGLLVLLLTGVWWRRGGYAATWLLVGVGLGLELFGFASRIIISGRPPVTDLYETVIWVSFIGMVFAVILEAVYRRRYFFYAGLPAAILTLIVADSDSTILDASINPLTAVLRNNMWLTIHVLTIVSSYAAFALTAALGHIALAMTFWGRRYARAQAEVQFFIYRAMQIGILLLATGTILGGVWANYSWGRFWGWDPKETWALITLLCYLALVHGRLAGWWRGFGLAVGSVVCFLSVMMSWYGVNFILGQNGKSLHSYGLSTGGLGYAGGFAGVELAFVAAVLLWNRRSSPPTAADVPVPEREEELAGKD